VTRVSAIIPVFNGEKYLAEAIQSVLGQSLAPLELLIVDDGSTDGSVEVAEGFGSQVRILRQNHLGSSAARNYGVERSQGEYLAFLDADDRWLPEKLEKQIKALEQDPGAQMAFVNILQFISPELSAEVKAKKLIPREILPGYSPIALLIRRRDFLCVGNFNPEIAIGEFMEWYLRAQETGLKSTLIPEVLVERRIHEANQGIRDKQFQGDYHRVLKFALDRRRKAAQAP